MARFLITALAIFLLSHPRLLQAADIRFQVQSYGDRQAIVTLTGREVSSLTTSISNDGRSVRISGVNVVFGSQPQSEHGEIISNVHQVKRGAFTDLILVLTTPSSLSATPAAQELRLYIKARASSDAASVEGSNGGTRIRILLNDYDPARFKSSPGLTIIIPSLGPALTPLSTLLRGLALLLDHTALLFSPVTKQPEVCSAACTAKFEAEIARLKALNESLTRKELR